MTLLRDLSRRGLLLSLCLMLVTGIALADKPKAAITQPSDLMTFDNVSVANATPSKDVKPKTQTASRQVAYATEEGQLASATPDRAKALEAAAPSANTAADDPVALPSPSGGTLIAVGDEQAVFQVARKDGDRVVTSEVVGKSEAQKSATVKSASKQAASKEVANER